MHGLSDKRLKISIVTISYNQGKFLEQTILSVINQCYENIEYIIVDPGSTDRSREIINKYSDHFSHIVLEPDAGPSDGLNKGFLRATGDIYGFINSDDKLLPDALHKVSEFFKNNKHADVISGHSLIIDERNEILRKCYSNKFSLKMNAYGACTLMQPSTFFRKDCFHKTTGFNIKNCCCWDDELFVDMGLNGASFHIINEFLSSFRIHSNSINASGCLDQETLEYYDRKFYKIINRKKEGKDAILSLYYKLIKHIRNPSNLIEKLRKR